MLIQITWWNTIFQNCDDLFDICSTLIVDVLTDISVGVYRIENDFGEFSIDLSNGLNRESYRQGFNYTHLNYEDKKLVDSLYDKIAKCEMEYFLNLQD